MSREAGYGETETYSDTLCNRKENPGSSQKGPRPAGQHALADGVPRGPAQSVGCCSASAYDRFKNSPNSVTIGDASTGEALQLGRGAGEHV